MYRNIRPTAQVPRHHVRTTEATSPIPISPLNPIKPFLGLKGKRVARAPPF